MINYLVKSEMDVKYWFEKGKEWFDSENWDQSFLAFSKIFATKKNEQVIYPYLAYSAFKSNQESEIDFFINYPFKHFLITDVDNFEKVIPLEKWNELKCSLEKNSVKISKITGLALNYLTSKPARKLELIMDFSPDSDLELYWLHIFIFNFYKDRRNREATNADLSYTAVLSHYEKVISIFPNYALAYYLQAFYLSSFGFPQYDETYIRRAVELNPEYKEAHYCIGWLSFQDDEYEDSASEYTKFIESEITKSESFLDALEKRAYAYGQIHKHFEAILDYNRILEICPDKLETFILRAIAKRNYKDFRGAINDYSINIDNSNGDKYFKYISRADLYMEVQDYQSAIADYSSAISIDGSKSHVYNKRAEAYKALNQNELAKNDSSRASEILMNDIIKSDDTD